MCKRGKKHESSVREKKASTNKGNRLLPTAFQCASAVRHMKVWLAIGTASITKGNPIKQQAPTLRKSSAWVNKRKPEAIKKEESNA